MTCRVGVLGVGKELEDEVDDGGLGMVERVGVLGFEVRSNLFGGVAVFRAVDDREWGDGLVGEDGGRALRGRGLMGRVAFSHVTEVPGLSSIGTPPASPLSSSELLARLRVPR